MQRFLFGMTTLAVLILSGVNPVLAQASTNPADEPLPNVTIPLEVAMIYYKLLNTTPNFNMLALQSPRLANTSEFGRDALVTEEKVKLEKVYAAMKRDTQIVIREPMAISEIQPEQQIIKLKGLDGDTPFTYQVGNVNYGVFIRNATSMSPIRAPYFGTVEWSGLNTLFSERRHVLVEMRLKPMGADEENFTTYEDDVVKPIIADIVDLRIYNPEYTTSLLLNKRDEKVMAPPSKLENLVEEDLKNDDTLPADYNRSVPKQ